MAIRLTPEQEEDILMQGSVMDAPRSMLQKVMDFAWGRTLPEQATSAFTGGLGTMKPAWKLTKNAPSWLQRAFKGGKREVPLQGSTPRRVPLESPGLVKNPVTYELPESSLGLKQFLREEGGNYSGVRGKIPQQLSLDVRAWLLGKGGRPAVPETLYRGTFPGARTDIGQPYTHASPWEHIAQRQGRGGFGAHLKKSELETFPADPNQLYYRGGSLAGDPLESTSVNSIRGYTWEQALKRAKVLYSRYIKRGMEPTEAAASALDNFIKGTFETDVLNRPGVWAGGKPVPRKLLKHMPDLRTVDEVQAWEAKVLEQLGGSYGKWKLPSVSGGVDVPIEPGFAPYLKKYPNLTRLKQQVDPQDILSDEELITSIQNKLGRKLTTGEYDELLGGLEDTLADYDKLKKLPPVSGSAPSMFEKFTSKGLPIPQRMRDPGSKSTQDIIGNWAHREASKPSEFGARTVRRTDLDEFIQRFADQRMYSIRGALEENPVNPVEAVRELGKRFGADDVETAALVKRYETVISGNRGTVPLSHLLTPQKYNDLMNWVKSQLE